MPSAKLHLSLLPGFLALSLGTAALHAASLSDVTGVPNFHQVDEHVYRGGQPHGQGFASLAKIGIRTVIDLRGETSEVIAVQPRACAMCGCPGADSRLRRIRK